MIRKSFRWLSVLLLSANLVAATMPSALFADGDKDKKQHNGNTDHGVATTTPIKHLVVIFQENVSFDHYFGSYPDGAENNPGETVFTPRTKKANRTVNGLTGNLIYRNTNHIGSTLYPPIRLTPGQNYTCSQNHDYTPEQQAFDSGLMDKFPGSTFAACSATTYPDVSALGPQLVMGYFDGNTVTGLWNYAQYFAINDNFFDTNFGPSTPGAINVISGMTGGVDLSKSPTAVDGTDIYKGTVSSVIGDPDPAYDDCSTYDPVGMLSSNKNIGDRLTAAGITWGWFQGGFNAVDVAPYGGPKKWTVAHCTDTTPRRDGTAETAYSPHHNPFEYYLSTSNQHHVPPSSLAAIGTNTDQANHVYDLTAFWAAANAGYLPSVSYLKANRAQDGHPGNSSPLDEQAFIVDTLNKLQALPEWKETAVIITYDDSDGWYDHVMSPIVNQSATADDAINTVSGAGSCGTGVAPLAAIQGRCGFGPRLPFLVVSPYAKSNFVDNTLTDQSSVVAFIEENWELLPIGAGSFDEFAGTLMNMFNFDKKNDNLNGPLLLNVNTGQVVFGGDK